MTVSTKFRSFVIFAEMRTGSNFLESNLNQLDGVSCLGEAFNPVFLGYPGKDRLLGQTLQDRDADPFVLLQNVRDQDQLCGFRYFHDHDPRVLQDVLSDPTCAKIVLSRNALDSFVSLKIAQDTGQWKLTNVTKRKHARIWFDGSEFSERVAVTQAFRTRVFHALRVSGQTAFSLRYEDLHNLEVLNGLVAWLGVSDRLDRLNPNLKRQNPEPALDKVENPQDVAPAVLKLDSMGLDQLPPTEPTRGPVVPSYIAGVRTPLLYLPIPGGPGPSVRRWLAALDGVAEQDLTRHFTQRSLRGWKEDHPDHLSFTIVRHPLDRAYSVFCKKVLPIGKDGFAKSRRVMQRTHGVVLPETWPLPGWTRDQQRGAFLSYLKFLGANLAGQTVLNTKGQWATQSQCLQGLVAAGVPRAVFRENRLQPELQRVTKGFGHATAPQITPETFATPFPLGEIYTSEIERASRAAYGRDYTEFGFQNWGQAA